MKANLRFSLKDGNSLLIEFVAENQGESDFLALILENMRHKEPTASIFGYAEVKGTINKIDLSITVKQEEKEVIAQEPTKKSYLC